MSSLRPICFADALRHLHSLLGAEVKVTVNDHGRFFGCGFEGTLERVQTLPPDDKVVRLVLRGGAGIFLDPADVRVFESREDQHVSLEIRVTEGPTVTID